MVKTAQELITELKEGVLSTFWISRNEDTPWVDKTTIVTKKQETEIINLFIEFLKSKKTINIPKNKNITGFCKKEVDLSNGIYDFLKKKYKSIDFIIYAENNEYLGMSVLLPKKTDDSWGIYVNYLCSVKKGTGTKIMNLMKDAIKTNKNPAGIELSPVSSAVDFYKKMGFEISKMVWIYAKDNKNVEKEVKVSTGGNKTLRNKLKKMLTLRKI